MPRPCRADGAGLSRRGAVAGGRTKNSAARPFAGRMLSWRSPCW